MDFPEQLTIKTGKAKVALRLVMHGTAATQRATSWMSTCGLMSVLDMARIPIVLAIPCERATNMHAPTVATSRHSSRGISKPPACAAKTAQE